MNGHDFIVFYERYALYKLAEYLKVLPIDLKHVTLSDPNHNHDIEDNAGFTYDVKMSSPALMSKERKFKVWDFDLRSGANKKPKKILPDFYILIGMLRGIPSKTFLIPAGKLPYNHLRISIQGISKY